MQISMHALRSCVISRVMSVRRTTTEVLISTCSSSTSLYLTGHEKRYEACMHLMEERLVPRARCLQQKSLARVHGGGTAALSDRDAERQRMDIWRPRLRQPGW